MLTTLPADARSDYAALALTHWFTYPLTYLTTYLLTHLLTYSVTYLPAVAASDPAFYTYLLNHLTNLPIYLLA